MKKCFLFFGLVLALLTNGWAAVPPFDKLLPDDTLFVVSIPDVPKLKTNFANAPEGLLWADPGMKPFRDNFTKKFGADVLAPLEKELGVKIADYQALAQGQVALALTKGTPEEKKESPLSLVFLMDVKDKKDTLKTNLADLKNKWTDSGKQIKTQKIRDIDFTTLITTDEEIDKIAAKFSGDDTNSGDPASDAKEKKPAKKIEISVGQSDSLLIVGTSQKVIEKILARQAGGLVPALAEQPVYQKDQAGVFRDADILGWINLKSALDLAALGGGGDDDGAFMKTQKALGTFGLTGLKSLGVTFRWANDGGTVQIFVDVPESERQGIVKILTAETKDSNPPPFVPGDAVKFSRWRLDMQKTWAGLETMLTQSSPAMAGIVKMVFDLAGKDQDPNFDLRKELIGNLGDDLVSYEKAPRGSSVAELNSAPSLFLISSSNPEKLANALKVGMSSMGGKPAGDGKEREFLGRKIYTAVMAAPLGLGASKPPTNIYFSASGGYVGVSSDVSMLEEYLRSSDGKGKMLSQTPGLPDAAQKVGGMGTGLFGYNNQNDQMRATIEAYKKEGGEPATPAASNPFGPKLPLADAKAVKAWFDFSLLPPFETISKYFYFNVYAGGFDATGFKLKFFSPVPPQLKK